MMKRFLNSKTGKRLLRKNQHKGSWAWNNFTKDLPTSKDWQKKGKVTSVKDQGSCGSCWAFAVIALVEASHNIQKGNAYNLSEQNLVDCDSGSSGCSGGYTPDAAKYVKNNGVHSESNYAYTGTDDRCKSPRGTKRYVSKVTRVLKKNSKRAIMMKMEGKTMATKQSKTSKIANSRLLMLHLTTLM